MESQLNLLKKFLNSSTSGAGKDCIFFCYMSQPLSTGVSPVQYRGRRQSCLCMTFFCKGVDGRDGRDGKDGKDLMSLNIIKDVINQTVTKGERIPGAMQLWHNLLCLFI